MLFLSSYSLLSKFFYWTSKYFINWIILPSIVSHWRNYNYLSMEESLDFPCLCLSWTSIGRCLLVIPRPSLLLLICLDDKSRHTTIQVVINMVTSIELVKGRMKYIPWNKKWKKWCELHHFNENFRWKKWCRKWKKCHFSWWNGHSLTHVFEIYWWISKFAFHGNN